MTKRRITTYEFDGAAEVRDDAAEYMKEFFPDARVELHLSTNDGEVGVVARVGDTAPHDPAAVIDGFVQLGITNVSLIDHQPPDTLQRPGL